MTAPPGFDEDGWLHGDVPWLRHAPSPNYDARPDAVDISLVVIHAISLPPNDFSGDAIECFFQNRLDAGAHPYFRQIADLRVSAHFLIRRDGEVVQFVAVRQRAWHAGVSCWLGRERCNDFSLGIELEGSDDCDFCDAQYTRLNELLVLLRARYPIDAIAGHSDIAPGRKTDPGPCFDWQRVVAPEALLDRRSGVNLKTD